MDRDCKRIKMKGKKKKPLMLPFLLGDVKPEPISGLTRRAADGAWSGPSSLGHNSLPQPGARWGHSGAVPWLRDPQGHGWSSRDPSTPCKLHCRVVRHSIPAQPESGTASLPSPSQAQHPCPAQKGWEKPWDALGTALPATPWQEPSLWAASWLQWFLLPFPEMSSWGRHCQCPPLSRCQNCLCSARAGISWNV